MIDIRVAWSLRKNEGGRLAKISERCWRIFWKLSASVLIAIDLSDALSRGEGLVVKKLECIYQTNSRGADWVKVKPEYSDQMGENLDVLVLGGWWGKGGRTGKISSLLCGLRVSQEDDDSGVTPQ